MSKSFNKSSDYKTWKKEYDALTAQTDQTYKSYLEGGEDALQKEADFLDSHGDFLSDYSQISEQAANSQATESQASAAEDSVLNRSSASGMYNSGASLREANKAKSEVTNEAIDTLWGQAQTYYSQYLEGLSSAADRGEAAVSDYNTAKTSQNANYATAIGNHESAAAAGKKK